MDAVTPCDNLLHSKGRAKFDKNHGTHIANGRNIASFLEYSPYP